MTKPTRLADRFICQSCGAVHPKWSGRCDACDAWNSIVEEPRSVSRGARTGRGLQLVELHGTMPAPDRMTTGIAEFDRACGGGLVPGSALLVGGDPGIGKSTLLLQIAAALANRGRRVVYVSGEEAIDQVRGRAERLGLAGAPVALAAETALGTILRGLEAERDLSLVVIDSIQTMALDTLDSAPGTVAQVRAGAQELVRLAKTRGCAVILVGHVTKDGQIAGPKVVEHLVDAVLYFEGERNHQFRILRTVKNRFGPTDEIGVFAMEASGLAEVANPSALFVGRRVEAVPGSVVFAGMEGTRPLLVEVQALVAPSVYGTPRRAAVGWDAGRLAMVLAVLEARCGVSFGGQDVYLNVAGGLRIAEPAADLAAAAALVSALSGAPIAPDCVFLGEISLAGEIRPVPHVDARLKEAEKLGFRRATVPAETAALSGLTLDRVGRLQSLVDQLAEAAEQEPAC